MGTAAEQSELERLRRRYEQLWAEFLAHPKPRRDSQLRRELHAVYEAGLALFQKHKARRSA